MDYGRFLRLRRPLWEELARGLERLRDVPSGRRGRRARAAASYDEVERLAFAYRQVLHDHALAATRFPGTGAARQLAALALEGTHQLTLRRSRWRGLRHFALHAFPAAFHRQLGLLGLATAVFGAACLLGLALSAVQPGLGKMLLGPRAIEGGSGPRASPPPCRRRWRRPGSPPTTSASRCWPGAVASWPASCRSTC
jgi:uncharacterized membrane protein YedE/YeeE